nr:hypothetical protein [Bacillus cereus]
MELITSTTMELITSTTMELITSTTMGCFNTVGRSLTGKLLT